MPTLLLCITLANGKLNDFLASASFTSHQRSTLAEAARHRGDEAEYLRSSEFADFASQFVSCAGRISLLVDSIIGGFALAYLMVARETRRFRIIVFMAVVLTWFFQPLLYPIY